MRSGHMCESICVPEKISEKLDLDNSSGRNGERIIGKAVSLKNEAAFFIASMNFTAGTR